MAGSTDGVNRLTSSAISTIKSGETTTVLVAVADNMVEGNAHDPLPEVRSHRSRRVPTT
jgi:hypothetical protein